MGVGTTIKTSARQTPYISYRDPARQPCRVVNHWDLGTGPSSSESFSPDRSAILPFRSLALFADHNNLLPHLYVHDAEPTILVAIHNFACWNGTAEEYVGDPFRMGWRPGRHSWKRIIVGWVRDNADRLSVSPLYSSDRWLSPFPFDVLQALQSERSRRDSPRYCEVAYHRTFEGLWRNVTAWQERANDAYLHCRAGKEFRN